MNRSFIGKMVLLKFKYYDARKGATSRLSYDGKFVYVWEKKIITKLSTQ